VLSTAGCTRASSARKPDLFETENVLQEKIERLERTVEERGLQLRGLQAELADALAPYVVRRQRACIGESRQRRDGLFKYPTIKSERRDTDRIDSPHSTIRYFTFDLPGLVLSSDKKARGRVENIALLSGVGADELSEEIKEFAAGDLTDLVLNQIKKPRILRPNNYFDQVEALKREVSDDVMRRVCEAKPKGLWGAELCLLASQSPATILMLGGRTGDLRNPHVQAPRLLLLREIADQTEISGDQAEAGRHLVAAFRETKRRGLHLHSPRLDQVSGLLANLAETLPNLTHWDIRPARTVSILASLARFLSGQVVDDGGRSIFGDLTLPALEKLAEAWAQELDPSWIEAKQAISDKSAKDKSIPDYLGISSIEELFYAQAQSKLGEIRSRAETLLDFCRAASEGQSTGVLDRVSTVFVGQEEV
jgi:hypothetical protein